MARWKVATVAANHSRSVPLILRILPYLVLFTLALPPVLAQGVTLVPSAASDSFPACALSCSLLQQAQNACVPPAAPVTADATYVSCFCQSTLISQLHSTGDGTCDSECSNESDRSLLQSWYNNFCSSGGTVVKAGTETSDASSSSSSDGAANAVAAAASRPPATVTHGPPPSWISTHYRWVIMVIVLAVGFGVIAAVGVWLKRRHDAKYPHLYHGAGKGVSNASTSGILFTSMREQGGAKSPGPDPTKPGMWGPHQAMAHPSGFDYANAESVASSSRTEMAAVETQQPSGRRLQKPPEAADDEIREVR